MLVSADTLPDNLPFDEMNPLIAQKYVDGEQLCSYAIARKGDMHAFSCYSSPFTIGLGTCITFVNRFDKRIFTWVQEFVRKYNFTGQISFDFIIDGDGVVGGDGDDGMIKVIECNPRLTSGIHLFSDGEEFANALFGGNEQTLFGTVPGRKMTVPLLLSLPKACCPPVTIKQWVSSLLNFKDVLYDAKDRDPFSRQLHIVSDIARVARKRGISLSEASTYDIEWNGVSRGP